MPRLAAARPELLARYAELYGHGVYAGGKYQDRSAGRPEGPIPHEQLTLLLSIPPMLLMLPTWLEERPFGLECLKSFDLLDLRVH
jgi:hypothetical protein